jgi:predicted amino acid racemase
MVELGDLREGIMPGDLEDTVREALRLPNIALKGIGTNLACRSGVSPDVKNMAELSALVESIEAVFGLMPGPMPGNGLGIVSGGNSANLPWALSGADTGRINDLRLGEAILLGCEPLHRQPIDGLFTDAIALVAEVIESKVKPSEPWGEIAQAAFGDMPPAADRGPIAPVILAVGRQDTDPEGLQPPAGIEILGASSDHLIVDSGSHRTPVGGEITFQLTYSALVRAMTSPFVAKVVKGRRGDSLLPRPATSRELRGTAAGVGPPLRSRGHG